MIDKERAFCIQVNSTCQHSDFEKGKGRVRLVKSRHIPPYESGVQITAPEILRKPTRFSISLELEFRMKLIPVELSP